MKTLLYLTAAACSLVLTGCNDRLETKIQPTPESNEAPSWYWEPSTSHSYEENNKAREELLLSWRKCDLPMKNLSGQELKAMFESLSPNCRFYSQEIFRLNPEAIEELDPDPATYLSFAVMAYEQSNRIDDNRNPIDYNRTRAFWCACGGFQTDQGDPRSRANDRTIILQRD